MSLADAVTECFRLMNQQKAAGVPKAEREQGLEALIRQVWPFTREWKYLCQACRDYGLQLAECPGDATCGRTKPHLPHEFGTPCWCSVGAKFKPKPKPSAEDFTAAGKAPSKMTRVGR